MSSLKSIRALILAGQLIVSSGDSSHFVTSIPPGGLDTSGAAMMEIFGTYFKNAAKHPSLNSLRLIHFFIQERLTEQVVPVYVSYLEVP